MRNVLTFLLSLLLSACALPGAAPVADTYLLPTLSPTRTQARPTRTVMAMPVLLTPASATPTLTPTPALTLLPGYVPQGEPLTGVALATVSVWAVPGQRGKELPGKLELGQQVKVFGRNETAVWLYIVFAGSPTGTGWVQKKDIDLDGDLGRLSIVVYPPDSNQPDFLPPLLHTVIGTPLPLNTPS
jgi:hypothetical protein